jgi:hypothetical protein
MNGVPFGRAQGQRAAQLMELLGLSEEELCQILDVDPGVDQRGDGCRGRHPVDEHAVERA